MRVGAPTHQPESPLDQRVSQGLRVSDCLTLIFLVLLQRIVQRMQDLQVESLGAAVRDDLLAYLVDESRLDASVRELQDLVAQLKAERSKMKPGRLSRLYIPCAGAIPTNLLPCSFAVAHTSAI